MRTSALRAPFACLLALVSLGSALAQYRPPPATEAEQQTYAGDDLRAEAAKALAGGDKAGASEAYRKAMAAYEKALALDPNSVAAAAGLGDCGAKLGEYDRVVKALAPVNAAHPSDLDVAFQLGVAYYKLKRPEGVALLEKVSPANKPEHLIGHFYLAQYYLQQQRGKDAVAELVSYLRLRPPEVAANDYEVHTLLGRAFLVWRKPAEARASFERAQKDRPESVPIQMGLAAVLEQEGRTEKAIAHLEGLAARNPNSGEARERLGRLLLSVGNLPKADAVASELLKLKNTPQAQLLVGDVRLAQKRSKEAQSALESALQQAPGWPPAQISLARAFQQQGRNDEAVGLLEKAVASGAGSLEVLAALGSVNRRAGRFQRAVEVHLKVLQAAPNAPLGHLLLGADYFATGEWDKSIEHYTTAVSTSPDDPRGKHWLAVALSHRGRVRAEGSRVDDAFRDLRRAFDLDRTPEIGRNLGIVQLTQRDYKEARTTFQQIVTLPGANWKDQLLLGYALLGEAKAPESVAAFEQAAKLTKDDAQLAEIYAGWSMAKLEMGEFDTAVAKLMEPQLVNSVGKLAQANLPLALLRRALDRLREADVASAKRDLEAVDKLPAGKTAEVVQLTGFTRALLDAEEGRYDEASAGLRKAMGQRVKWANAQAKPLLDAYVEYRRGRMPQARKLLQANARRADPKQAAWAAELGKAIERRDAERSYAAGTYPAAEKAMKAAVAGDPLNPYVVHNQACLQYRKGGTAEAVKTWTTLLPTVPESALNLGIDAQTRAKDPQLAADYYSKYLQSGGARGAMVAEWRNRLQSIYGVAVAQGSESPPADEAPANPPTAKEGKP